jgi:endonuclease YncB( thermonuclease family)
MAITVGSNEGLLVAAWLVGVLLLAAALRLPRITAWLRRRRASRPAAMPRPFTGKAFVIDGDTIHVSRARVRLHGIDAPELTQHGGWKARSHMIGLAGGREVAVEPIDVDCYGRIVARIWLGKADLAERMVHDGFARGVSDWCADYSAAEFDARRNRRGLWATVGIADPAAHRRWKAQTAPRR